MSFWTLCFFVNTHRTHGGARGTVEVCSIFHQSMLLFVWRILTAWFEVPSGKQPWDRLFRYILRVFLGSSDACAVSIRSSAPALDFPDYRRIKCPRNLRVSLARRLLWILHEYRLWKLSYTCFLSLQAYEWYMLLLLLSPFWLILFCTGKVTCSNAMCPSQSCQHATRSSHVEMILTYKIWQLIGAVVLGFKHSPVRNLQVPPIQTSCLM